MSASEPNLVAVHESCGRTCSEERAARHLTCTELLALLGLRMPCQVGIFEDALAPPARALLVLAVGEQRAFGAG